MNPNAGKKSERKKKEVEIVKEEVKVKKNGKEVIITRETRYIKKEKLSQRRRFRLFERNRKNNIKKDWLETLFEKAEETFDGKKYRKIFTREDYKFYNMCNKKIGNGEIKHLSKGRIKQYNNIRNKNITFECPICGNKNTQQFKYFGITSRCKACDKNMFAQKIKKTKSYGSKK